MQLSNILLVCLVLLFSVGVFADNYAVVVAGSSTYSNYRHQADASHAYQLLVGRGIPDENITIMMYDDIAENSQNPYPGTIINAPDGDNVYPGSDRIDYSGKDVTPDNFMNVLKSLPSSRANGDKVFVFFSDHGSYGHICFPSGGNLYADQLKDTVNYMYTNAMYDQLVVYIEACYSGSMGDVFPTDADAYLTTAANDMESSYACYWDATRACYSGSMGDVFPTDADAYLTTAANDMESSYACYWDATRGAYLGDLYSVSWMEDVDSHTAPSSETLETNYTTTQARCDGSSHVMQYGDLTIDTELMDIFVGGTDALKPAGPFPTTPREIVPVKDIDLFTALNRFVDGTGPRSAVHNEIQKRRVNRRRFQTIAERVAGAHFANALKTQTDRTPIVVGSEEFQCHKDAIEAYIARYGAMDYHAHQFSHYFHELCHVRNSEIIVAAINA
ncbi:Peptidase C13, legumain like protein [Aduncisulcus paluster]|uniref:Peptidase C13, legumain like protein n=1 Tax=Aduncisulcus paluster TaxID=2918883 RepID=A0ABQ5JWT7_9EUKA|nr:Peptidase C13, legumain like protein [Aduncisulcus paluster]